MKFVKLHQNGREILVNLSLVSEVYPQTVKNKSNLYLNLDSEGEQVYLQVDESLDEIYAKANGCGE